MIHLFGHSSVADCFGYGCKYSVHTFIFSCIWLLLVSGCKLDCFLLNDLKMIIYGTPINQSFFSERPDSSDGSVFSSLSAAVGRFGSRSDIGNYQIDPGTIAALALPTLRSRIA